MYDAKIYKIIDLFDLDSGAFYTFDTFKELFPNVDVDFLLYHGIVSSIPRSWRHELKLNNPSAPNEITWHEKYEKIIHSGKPTKTLYNFFRDSVATDASVLLVLWNNDLKTTLTQKKFNKLFIKIKKMTSSTKLRYFQYRIIVRALTLNTHVARWDPEVSPLCTFCETYCEDTTHLFTECVHVKKIWLALKKWCKYMHDINLQLPSRTIIFNDYNGPHSELINMYILITKFYVYKTKVQGNKLKFNVLMTDINRVKMIEKTIYNVQNKIRLFSLKWVEND